MSFYDGNGSHIAIFPIWRSAVATFCAAEHSIDGMPDNYHIYNIRIDGDAKFTTDDLDSIFQWRNAQSLAIKSEGDVAVQLLRRIDDFKEMTHLERLFVYIERHSYRELNVTVLLEELPAMQLAQFPGDLLSYEEIDDFVKIQKVPDGWTVEVVDKLIEFRKKKQPKQVKENDIFRYMYY